MCSYSLRWLEVAFLAAPMRLRAALGRKLLAVPVLLLVVGGLACSGCRFEEGVDLGVTSAEIVEQRGSLVCSERLLRLRRYKDAKLSITPEGIEIAADGRTAGLLLTYRLDPASRFHVQVSGRAIEGSATLRIRRGDAPANWGAAPAASLELVVAEVDRLELLVYSDQSFRYLLEAVEIDVCPGCKTDADLRAHIEMEVPELKDALAHDSLYAAELILDWVANNTDWTLSSAIVASTQPTLSARTASDVFFSIFEPNKGGVYCGGTSVFADKVFRLFGLHSFTINFGQVEDDLTHVTNVVAAGQEGEWHYYIFDATFNATFREKGSGRLLELFELVEWARDDRFKNVLVRTRPVSRRDWLAPADDLRKYEVVKSEENGLFVCARPSFSMEDYWSRFRPALVRNSFDPGPRGYLQLLQKRVFSVGMTMNPPMRHDFIRNLGRLDIPFGSTQE